MRRPLLVRGKHVIDFVFIFVKGVVNVDNLTAWVTENVGYTLFD